MKQPDPEKRERILNRYFPQHFDQCRPSFGKGCPFVRICHGRVDDPIAEGYQWRIPHHSTEEEQDAKD